MAPTRYSIYNDESRYAQYQKCLGYTEFVITSRITSSYYFLKNAKYLLVIHRDKMLHEHLNTTVT